MAVADIASGVARTCASRPIAPRHHREHGRHHHRMVRLSALRDRHRARLRQAQFFPKSDPLVGVLEAFSIFAIGFVARPFGAAVFGHFGDRVGRKVALIATLLITGFATLAVVWCRATRRLAFGVQSFSPPSVSFKASASAANGAARSCSQWNGRVPITITIAGLLRRARSSVRRPDCCSPIRRAVFQLVLR